MAKIGRPKVKVPMDVVDAACQFDATERQVLAVLASQGLKVSLATLRREIKRVHGMTFETFRDQKTDGTRLKLIQKAVKMANEGNATMLIFCLKHMCKWSEVTKHEVTGKDGTPFPDAPAVKPVTVIVALPRNGREAPSPKDAGPADDKPKT